MLPPCRPAKSQPRTFCQRHRHTFIGEPCVACARLMGCSCSWAPCLYMLVGPRVPTHNLVQRCEWRALVPCLVLVPAPRLHHGTQGRGAGRGAGQGMQQGKWGARQGEGHQARGRGTRQGKGYQARSAHAPHLRGQLIKNLESQIPKFSRKILFVILRSQKGPIADEMMS